MCPWTPQLGLRMVRVEQHRRQSHLAQRPMPSKIFQRVAPCCAGARQALLENVPREVCLISRCRVGLASSNARCSTSFGPAGSVTPEWIDGGTTPYHRPPSRAGAYGDRSRRRLLDRGDSADCGCRGLAVRLATTRIPGKSARRRPRAFVVTAALAGREGVVDLARRSVAGGFRCVGIWSRCLPFRCEHH